MTDSGVQFNKTRSLGDVISDSFLFIKQEYKPLSKLILVYVLPFILLYGFAQVFIQKKLMSGGAFIDPQSMADQAGPMFLNLIIVLLFNLFVQSLFVGAVYTYIDVYIKKGRGNFTIEDVSRDLFNNSLITLGAGFIYMLVFILGIFLCILPGIYFANSLSLTFMALIHEKKGINAALASSWNLVNRQWWNTLALNIFGVIFIWFIGFIISLPSVIAGFTSVLASAPDGEAVFPDWYWYLTGINTIVTSLCYLIIFVMLAMQYFNISESLKSNLPTSGNSH